MSNATTLNRPTPRQQTNTTQRPPRIPHRTPEPTPEPIPDPAPPQARRHTSELTPTEQGALLEDYFDNSVELATIASNAGVRLFDLVQWLASPPIQAKLDLIKAADLERAQRIAAHHAAVAMQAMAFIARQSPESDRSMETVRKAAAYVHRAAQPPKNPKRPRGKAPDPTDPANRTDPADPADATNEAHTVAHLPTANGEPLADAPTNTPCKPQSHAVPKLQPQKRSQNQSASHAKPIPSPPAPHPFGAEPEQGLPLSRP